MRSAHCSYSRGFSLLQLSILLAIASLLLVTILPENFGAGTIGRNESSHTAMRKVNDALAAFKAAYGRLPCPADGTLAPDDVNFGKESSSSGDCTTGAIAANFGPASESGADVLGNVVGGMLPSRTLQLPDSLALDSYSRRMSYIVDRRATEGLSCHYLKSGAIRVRNADSSRENTAMAVVISHGENGHGAFTSKGAAARMNSNSPDVNEQDNASVDSSFADNFDANFVSAGGSALFDDLLVTQDSCCLGDICTDPSRLSYLGPDFVLGETVNKFSTYQINKATDALNVTTNLSVAPLTNYGTKTDISSDNQYALVTSSAFAGNDYLTLYKRYGGKLVKLPPPVGAPTHPVYAVAGKFSHNGEYLVTTHFDRTLIAGFGNYTHYANIYQRSGDVFNKVSEVALAAGAVLKYTAITKDAGYLAAAQTMPAKLHMYKREGVNFVAQPAPDVPPAMTQSANDITFSSHGEFLAYGSDSASLPLPGKSCITLYYSDAGILKKLVGAEGISPVLPLPCQGWALAFSADDRYFAVHIRRIAPVATNELHIYKRSGKRFVRLTGADGPQTVPGAAINSLAFSVDGNYLLVAHASAAPGNILTLYKRNGDRFDEVAKGPNQPGHIGLSVTFSKR